MDGCPYDHKWSLKFDDCVVWFKGRGMEPFPSGGYRTHCNATWDGLLCWPSIPAGTKYTMQCPPEDGFNRSKTVTKSCHYSGRWAPKDKDDYCPPYGWTDYSTCYENQENKMDIIRVFEYMGLAISILALLTVIILLIASRTRRWQLTQIRLGFLTAMVFTYIIRLCLHIDDEFASTGGGMIYNKVYVCEAFMIVLEFSKLLIGSWFVTACFHGLFETASERHSERYVCAIVYAAFAFIYAGLCTGVWLCFLFFAQPDGHNFSCFGIYKQRVPSAYILLYGNLATLVNAVVFAITHAFYALYKKFLARNSRFSGIRWFVQSIAHLITSVCLLGVWYYDLRLPLQKPLEDEVYDRPVEGVLVTSFAGFFVAVLIGMAQRFLPVKETIRL